MGPAQAESISVAMHTSSSSAAVSGPSTTLEHLPANIPHLEPDGSNWAIFSIQFQEAMIVTRRWGHFEGTKSRPSPKDPANMSDSEKEEAERWEYDDMVASYLLSQRLPDTTMIRLAVLPTTHARWNRVTEEYTAKSVYAQNDLEQTFLEMHCPKGGDVQAFLTSLRYKKEELAAAGVRITNKDYQRTILRGIPEELAKFAAQIMTSAQLAHRITQIDTDTLIDHICEEAERIKNRRG
jgi:hypothetical protein